MIVIQVSSFLSSVHGLPTDLRTTASISVGKPEEKKPRYYKPPIHRTAAVVLLFLISLNLIALVEYALRALPHVSFSPTPNDTHITKRHVPKPTVIPGARLARRGNITHYPYTTLVGDCYTIHHSTETMIVCAATPTAYLNLEATTETLDLTNATPTPIAKVDPSTAKVFSTSVGKPTSDLYLKPVAATQILSPPPIPSAKAEPSVETITTLTQVTMPTTQPKSDYTDRKTSQNVVVQQESIQPESNDNKTPSPLIQAATTVLILPTLTTTVSAAAANSDVTILLKTVTIHTSALSPPSSTISESPSTTQAKPSSQPTILNSDRPLTLLKGNSQYYFIMGYLPVLLAVILRMVLGYFYDAMKMMEPFHTLCNSQGVKAKDFFWINYLSANDNFAPFAAMLSGHWTMLWTSIIYTAAQTLSPFAAELLHVEYGRWSDGRIIVSGHSLWINETIARVLQGLLTFICIMLVNVYMLLRAQKGGVYNDPSSIVSIASLLHHPEALSDFQRLDISASKNETLRQLDGRRYKLDEYYTLEGTKRYGIISLPDTSNSRNPIYTLLPSTSSQPTSPQYSNRKTYHILNALLMFLTSGLLILIIIYYKNNDKNSFELFMDSQSFGPRFLLAIVGILIKSQWKRLERLSSVRLPFQQLLNKNHPATATNSILATRPLIPISSLFQALTKGNLLVAIIAYTTILSEILIILLPGVPFSEGQLWDAAVVTWYFCIGILSFMIIVLLIIWCIKREEEMPKEPNAIGAMILYVIGAKWRENVADCGMSGKKELSRRVRKWGWRYQLVKGVERGQGVNREVCNIESVGDRRVWD